MATKHGFGKGEAALITDARTSPLRNYRYRRRTYAALQWSRIPLLLLAGAAFMWWHVEWLAVVLTIASVPMPWIAVVIANGVGEPADKRAPRVYKPGVAREEAARRERERLALARSAEDPGGTPNAPMRRDAEPGRGLGDAPIVIDMPETGEPGAGR